MKLKRRSTAITYPRVTHEVFHSALKVMGGKDFNECYDPKLLTRIEAAEQKARAAVRHDDYEAFEAEFMRIVESEAARKIIEEGL